MFPQTSGEPNRLRPVRGTHERPAVHCRPHTGERKGSSVDELLKTVQEKTGLDLDQAKGAIEAVMGFLKDKLPEPIAGQLDKFVGGEGGDGDGGGLGDALGGIGDMAKGLFGGND